MQFMLGQFGISTYEPSLDEGTPDYLRFVLGRTTDMTLSALEEYVLGQSPGNVDQSQLPWDPDTFRLFVSHTHAYASLAGAISKHFKSWGIHAFVAHEAVKPTREWERVIEAALDSCDAMTALITPDFVKSRWCDQEVGWCRGRKVPIVPVKLGDEDPHGFIGKIQAARPEEDRWPWVADAIFRALALNPIVAREMARPVVYRYAQSHNPDGAGLNFGLLGGIPEEAWTRELVELVERAPEENDHVAQGTLRGTDQAVPEASTELLAPIRERLGMNLAVPVVSAEDDEIPF
jgi:hypothetical protein